MTDIWVIRHGEAVPTSETHRDPDLTALGREQAALVPGKLLASLPSDVTLLSSPLARAQQTAEPLAKALSTSVTVVPAFREIPVPVSITERDRWLKAYFSQQWAEQPATLWQWRHALIVAMANVTTPTVIFSHFLVINTLIGHIQGTDDTVSVMPANTSINHFRRVEGRLQIVSVGEQLKTRIN